MSRCKSGTLGGRYLNNGYVLSPIAIGGKSNRRTAPPTLKPGEAYLLSRRFRRRAQFAARQRYVEEVVGHPTFDRLCLQDR